MPSVNHKYIDYSSPEPDSLTKTLSNLENACDILNKDKSYSTSNTENFFDAELSFLEALDKRKRLLGEDHLWVATSLNNLANLYCSQERYAEAEPLLQQALEIRKRLLGEDHPDVATSLNNLGNLYYSQGRYAEAGSFFQQALEVTISPATSEV